MSATAICPRVPARLARAAGVALGAALLLGSGGARAGLFDDDEARRAILELRGRVTAIEDNARARQAELTQGNSQLLEQVQQLRRSVLDLNNQIEALRADNARLRGVHEQQQRDLAELQRRLQDTKQGIDDRIRKMEPVSVQVDGKTFDADPEEKRAYDSALATLRGGEFDKGAAALGGFLRRWPASGYADSARFWLGNAQYGQKNYREAIAAFRALATAAPDHPRTPEALLGIANCQVEMRDTKAARRTLDELVKAYPQSEAAQAGRERLAALK